MVASKAVENDGDKCGLPRYYHEVCIHQLQPGLTHKISKQQHKYPDSIYQGYQPNFKLKFQSFQGFYRVFCEFSRFCVMKIPGYSRI